MAAVSVENLSFTYAGAAAPALKRVSFRLEAGEFGLLFGRSGCGKSTLLRCLMPEIAPVGAREGAVHTSGRVGMVMQDPDMQIVCDTVRAELAFGLENMGLPPEEIRRRIGETSAFFGLDGLAERECASLSGGQKQLLNLAAVTAMQPDILLLDEPCAQIDPASAAVLLAMLRRLNEQLGMTVLMSEHRLEDIYPAVTRVIAMEDGSLAVCAAPREAAAELADTPLSPLLPSPVRIWDALGRVGAPPLTVAEGAACVSAAEPHRGMRISLPATPSGEMLLDARGVYFRYERKSPDVVKSMDFSLRRGEITALMGGNGAGKSTALRLLAGQLRPLCGRLRRGGRAALLPQDIKPLFLAETVAEELSRLCADNALAEEVVHALWTRLGLDGLETRHPFDLSGGEQQRLALCKLLALSPDILLLDEPTKGLDAAAKAELLALLRELRDAGKAIAVVSHDAEFVARCADRCGLFWDGRVISELSAPEFFSSGLFYTTAARRISRHVFENAVTEEQVLELCGREARRG
ncbi:MAG: ATP-binding cassette domain-containing protein [Clostridia bacterium]|nr:ATP-binding cassette domain-containing protein [Clostridia bacterium]